MEINEELDRLQSLQKLHRQDLIWIGAATRRIGEMETEVRMGMDGGIWCHACQALYDNLKTKQYWVRLHGEYVKATDRARED